MSIRLPINTADRIARRHGIVTIHELVDAGVGRHLVRRLVTDGVLIAVHRGVYRVRTSPDTFEARCAAACGADADVFITGVAAAHLWRFRHVRPQETPIVATPHATTPIAHGVILRRTNVLDAVDVVERDDGIRVASPPRTWFDCARDAPDDRFESITEWVLDHHATVPTLWHTARRMTARGRPGLARVHRVMSKRGDWQRPAGSALERRVLQALERRGVGPLVRQFELRLPNGTSIHPDGAVPPIKWAVEVDHVTWHGGRFDAQRDKGRDRNARRIGWQVDRVTDQECASDFDSAIDELVELFHLRRAELRAA